MNCRSTPKKSVTQIQRELFEERCGIKSCRESERDGYYQYAGFPEYYYKESDITKSNPYRGTNWNSRYPYNPNSFQYPYRYTSYGR